MTSRWVVAYATLQEMPGDISQECVRNNWVIQISLSFTRCPGMILSSLGNPLKHLTAYNNNRVITF